MSLTIHHSSNSTRNKTALFGAHSKANTFKGSVLLSKRNTAGQGSFPKVLGDLIPLPAGLTLNNQQPQPSPPPEEKKLPCTITALASNLSTDKRVSEQMERMRGEV